MSGDLSGAMILGGVFAALVLIAEVWSRVGSPRPEWTRKLVHVAGGIVCLLFPFLIRSPWVVLAMALALSAVFGLAGRIGALRSLHAVERQSRGVEYYPLAIWLVFFLTPGQAWLYVAAVLVLAVGDAFAALVGSRYGVIRYGVEDDRKSLEGSFVFLIVSFLAIHLPMLLLTDLPRETSVLAALLVALLVTGFEAVSLGGADNVFVPLGVVIILGKITTKPLPEIVFQNLSLVAVILVMVLMTAWVPLFNVGGTIVFILFAYGSWSLGSWHWALPVFIGLACYLALWGTLGSPERAPRLRVRAVARALLTPFLFLAIANGTGRHETMFGPYLAANASVLVFALARPLFALPRRSGWKLAAGLLGLTLGGSAAVGLPAWLTLRQTPVTALVAIPAVLLPAVFVLMRIEGVHTRETPEWTASRFLLGLAAAGAVVLLQTLGLTPSWSLP